MHGFEPPARIIFTQGRRKEFSERLWVPPRGVARLKFGEGTTWKKWTILDTLILGGVQKGKMRTFFIKNR